MIEVTCCEACKEEQADFVSPPTFVRWCIVVVKVIKAKGSQGMFCV